MVLAVVQGVAEFLPISSSGHLVLLGGWLGVHEIADLNIVLHGGTLLSIVVFYWRRVVSLLREDRRIVPLLAAGTAPAVVLGLLVKELMPELLESSVLAGAMLIVTGALLLLVSRLPLGDRVTSDLSWREATLIGAAQAAAILPGLSRSGATISLGLQRRLDPAHAASFSFLLAIPIIAGGACYELLKQFRSDTALTTPPGYLAAGALVAFLVGWVSLIFLARVIERGHLHRFAWWCIPLGVIVLASQWL
ncbi:MAG: undecaprenyl-diphosphate phosphatase [Planctomycetales bacterium]|nr:undecaprenyl-diphosphate phosphatase [Planctomycetales bacterium]